MLLGDILLKTASQYPRETAIYTPRGRYSFDQVAVATRALASELVQLDIKPDDRVLLLLSNCPSFSVAYFATLWSGAVVIPINPVLSDRELQKIIVDSSPQACIVQCDFYDRVEPLLGKSPQVKLKTLPTDCIEPLKPDQSTVEFQDSVDQSVPLTDEDKTAVILYTSGTTGVPKGVQLTHRNLVSNAQSVSLEKFSPHVLGPGEIGLAALPLSHAFGQTNLQNGIWFSGGAVVYQSRFDAGEALNLITRYRVTFFAGVPTMVYSLLDCQKNRETDETSLKFCVCGGAPLDSELKSRFLDKFGVSIQESYGLTETSPMISCQKIGETEKSGCVGRPIEGVRIRILDEQDCDVPPGEKGEVIVQGHNVFSGYFRHARLTAESFVEGWFRTGDIGKIDSDGELWIVDRKKEIILTRGYSVYPREVEAILHQHPAVEQTVVVGITDAKYGECVQAFVTLAVEQGGVGERSELSDDELGLEDELSQHCRKHLASFKCPQAIRVVAEFPLNSTGKIDRNRLKKNLNSVADSRVKNN